MLLSGIIHCNVSMIYSLQQQVQSSINVAFRTILKLQYTYSLPYKTGLLLRTAHFRVITQ